MGYNLYHVFVFLDTFMVYAAFHAIRQGWAYSKSDISSTFGVSKKYLGIVDALFLMFYSFGMVVLGSFMHRFTLRVYVIMGLTVASICYMAWSVIYSVTGFYNVVFMTILMCINGFFQATGWPGVIGIFSQWFVGYRKGVLMAIWSCSANAGDIIASVLLNVFSNHDINLVWNFVLTGGMALLAALSLFFFLKQKPDKQDMEGREAETQKSYMKELQQMSENPNDAITPAIQEEARQVQNTQKDQKNQKAQKVQKVQELQEAKEVREEEKPETLFKYGIFSALCIPKVPMYVLSYACIKGFVYGLFFWLPTILNEKGGEIAAQRGYINAMFDIGSIAGSLFEGFLADRYQRRALYLSPSLFLTAVVTFLLSFALNQVVWPYYIAIFFLGFFIMGPYNIVGILLVIDIGEQIKQKEAVAKVSSLNEGFGSIFTAISMIAIPYLEQNVVFYLFTAECLIATIVLIPPFISEIQDIRSKKKIEETETQ